METPRRVSFETADRGKVYANVYGQGPRTVILAHGAAFLKESWDPLAQELSRRGYRVLALNFRGYGKSVAGYRRQDLQEDVLAAIRFLEKRGAKSVSVIGGSMGGGFAAEAAVRAKEGEIDKLILLSPTPIDEPHNMNAGRILFVASYDEEMRPLIEDQFVLAPDPKEIKVFEGDAHGQHIFDSKGKELTKTIVSFLDLEPPDEE